MAGTTIEYRVNERHSSLSLHSCSGFVRIRSNGTLLTEPVMPGDSDGFIEVDSLYFLFFRLLYACKALHNRNFFRFPVVHGHVIFDFRNQGDSTSFRILFRDINQIATEKNKTVFRETGEGTFFRLEEFTREVITVSEDFIEVFSSHNNEEEFIRDFHTILDAVKNILTHSPADIADSGQRSPSGSGNNFHLDLVIHDEIPLNTYSLDLSGKLQIAVNGTVLTKEIPGSVDNGFIELKSLNTYFLYPTQELGTILYGYPLRIELTPTIGIEFTPLQDITSIRLFCHKSWHVIDHELTEKIPQPKAGFSVKTSEILSEILRVCDEYYHSAALMIEGSDYLLQLGINMDNLKRTCTGFMQDPSRYQRRTTSHNGLMLEFNGWKAGCRISLNGLILTKRIDDDFDEGFIHDFPDSFYEGMINCIHDLLDGKSCDIPEYDCSDFYSEFIVEKDIVWFRYATRNSNGHDCIEEARKRFPNYECGTPLKKADLIPEMIKVCEEYFSHVDYSFMQRGTRNSQSDYVNSWYHDKMKKRLEEEKIRYQESISKT